MGLVHCEGAADAPLTFSQDPAAHSLPNMQRSLRPFLAGWLEPPHAAQTNRNAQRARVILPRKASVAASHSGGLRASSVAAAWPGRLGSRKELAKGSVRALVVGAYENTITYAEHPEGAPGFSWRQAWRCARSANISVINRREADSAADSSALKKVKRPKPGDPLDLDGSLHISSVPAPIS
jgi:hypothetical protein